VIRAGTRATDEPFRQLPCNLSLVKPPVRRLHRASWQLPESKWFSADHGKMQKGFEVMSDNRSKTWNKWMIAIVLAAVAVLMYAFPIIKMSSMSGGAS